MLRLPPFRAQPLRRPALAATACKMATAAMCDTGCNTGAMCDCVRAGLDYTPLWYRSRPNTAIPLMCQAASFHIERRTSAWSA
jgi:hypothetical protein